MVTIVKLFIALCWVAAAIVATCVTLLMFPFLCLAGGLFALLYPMMDKPVSTTKS